ncbi:Uncharacterized membrane protein [Marinospirillum celere]|uniref:Uncharacterized membrane protein n=2 Tax=Marinospirillum celere TaxID=1122252 RepID=A0A1I1EQI7_9GAMM|nr:Uncharacterized membrane protein [Marinospirillum celere]
MSAAFSLLDWLALGWFTLCWAWYYEYSRRRQRSKRCLAGVMHGYRYDWMTRLLNREARIADATIMTHLERNGAFFASSALLILAALFGLMGTTERALLVLSDLPLSAAEPSRLGLELKLLLLITLFIYAFFTFTWSMRQYNFCAILIGSAPDPGEKDTTPGSRKMYAIQAANVIDLAANQFNYGLRAYYFGLALLAWFLHPVAFILATTGVVLVLYRREFHSKTLKALAAGRDLDVNFKGILQNEEVSPELLKNKTK